MEERKVIVNGKTYTYEQVEQMSIDEMSSLNREISIAIGDVNIKKQNYRNNNTEVPNSKEYWKKMSGYKTALIKLQQASIWVTEIRKKKNIEAHEDREHWFFTFYDTAKRNMKAKEFAKLKKSVIDKLGFELDC